MNKLKLAIISLLLLLVCGTIKSASAQTIPNPATVNVDNYSDQQIMQLLQQAQAAGLSDVQLLQKAQNDGMPTAQVQKLQNRIRDIRSKQSGGARLNDTIVMGGRRPAYKVDTLDTVNVKKDLFASLKPKIFGADLFNKKNNSFEPNLKLATPINYILGPDDQLNISVYGSSVVNWKLDVSPEGTINIPGIGILSVGGKTIENATALIKSKLAANNYAIGRGTNVQVSLGNFRSIKVTITGQVEKSGTFTLSSFATVFNALSAAGGPTENGTFRQIQVIRNNRVIRNFDTYDILTKGIQKDNIALQDQDVIYVPTYRVRVEMAGQVKIPALFEVLPGESLQDILNYAGGFTDSAYTARIIVSQVSDQQHKLTDVAEADYKSYVPLRGDKFIVQSILGRYENRVIITGAVFRPGEYELSKGLTLSQLIEKAAGIKEDAFVERGTITRLKADNTKELLSFSVKDVIDKAVTIPLQREDSVSISSLFDLRNKYKITINGSVRRPGTFAFAENMKVEDLIVKAGGFAEGASPKRIEVARRINDADPQSKSSKIANVFSVDVDSQLKLQNVNFVLMPFDNVSVYSLPGYEKQKTVKVEGEVLYPGSYTIQTKNEKVSDLLARAGGPTASADIEGASLKRENIAILGIDKNKSDTTEIAKERAEQINRLKKTYNDKDSTNTKQEDLQPRNNNVGIDLPGILKSPGSGIDLILEDGDVLRVPKQQQVVRVNGEVLFPSAVVYDGGKTFKGYVLNAGGFAPNALKSGAYVVYPNGTVKGTRKVIFFNSHPKVKPGSEIYVPKKPPHVGNTAQEVLGFTAGIASLAAIIFEIISLSK
jgi:protein involved in polysaccharide export with SLBB domain